MLILDGAEAGDAPAQICDVGTYARIVDFSGEPGGLLGIEARGERRFRILARRREKDGLNVAECRMARRIRRRLHCPTNSAISGPALDSVLDQVGEPFSTLERRSRRCCWVAGRLAEILPLSPAHKQHCLELDDPVARLRFLRPLFEITNEPPENVVQDDDDPFDPDEPTDEDDDELPDTDDDPTQA